MRRIAIPDTYKEYGTIALCKLSFPLLRSEGWILCRGILCMNECYILRKSVMKNPEILFQKECCTLYC